MKYFVFDVDGTLLNSAEVDQQCLKQTLHEFGRDYTFEELRPSFGKPGRQTLADLGFTGETAERIMDRWEGLSKERASEVLAFDGIEALLRELHGRGITIMQVTHRLEEVIGADRVIVLDQVWTGISMRSSAWRTRRATNRRPTRCSNACAAWAARRPRRSISATARAIWSAPPRQA